MPIKILAGLLIAAGALLYSLFELRRVRCLYASSRALWGKEAGRRLARVQAWGSALSLLALCFLVAALLSTNNERPINKSNGDSSDVAIVLDVSNSMTLRDQPPSRLERAKARARQILSVVGDRRYALVLYKGAAETVYPLTSDVPPLMDFLDDCGPGLISAPGTNLAEGLRRALLALDNRSAARKTIVLLTDGEALRGDALAAGQEAARQGVEIIAFGFGSDQGAAVPQRYSGKRNAHSSLNADLLNRLAQLSGGAYAPDSDETAASALTLRVTSGAESRLFGGRRRVSASLDVIFAFLSLVCFLLSACIRLIKPRRLKAIGIACVALCLFSCGNVASIMRNEDARRDIRHGDYESASATLLTERGKGSLVAAQTRDYNLAICYAALGESALAEELLVPLKDSASSRVAANASYNLGCLYAAQDRWQEAWSAFKDSLEKDSERSDARINLELARENINKDDASQTRERAELDLTPAKVENPEEFQYIRQQERNKFKNSQRKSEAKDVEDY
jgi:Ca-activated chloride channel family protein